MPPREYPGGKKFAFTIIDDTDVATVENIAPVYRLLEDLGLRITKTVWPVACPEGSRDFSSSQTLQDADYREFVQDLQRRGFEIAFHGATMESSRRERTLAAFERFRATFGDYPRVHANHAFNRENLYWGVDRFDHPIVRFLYSRLSHTPRDYYQGHVEDSPYWWGDLCQRHVEYVRNLTFNEINLVRANPSMPYHDPARPLVSWWFSATNAEDRSEFNDLLQPALLDRLERERGFCIVATHLGKGFARGADVHPVTRRRLEDLARRPGWFPTTGELLDWLRGMRESESLPRREWQLMQLRWARDLVVRKWKQSRRKVRRKRQ